MGRYDDIINLPHYVSEDRAHMPRSARAAQFAPFAALTGYDDEIKETARLTDCRAELDEYVIAELNGKLVKIKDRVEERPEIEVTYFVADGKKSGGKYLTLKVNVIKIDEYRRCVVADGGIEIPIDDIYGINTEWDF